MIHLILIVLLFILGLLVNLSVARKPLSEDDGNWYYLSVFGKRGVRQYKNFNNFYGYFGVPWMASKVYSLIGSETLVFFYYFKTLWYSLNAVSIYSLAFCFWHDPIFAFVAGMLFFLITAVPNTLFVLTYAEHFFILPINLSIIFTYNGIVSGNLCYFLLGGLMSAWAVQIKPTTLLFSIVMPLFFCLAQAPILAILIYTLIFVGLNVLPVLIIKQYGSKAQINYLMLTFGPVISIIDMMLDKITKGSLNVPIPGTLKLYDNYIKNHHNRSFQSQWSNINGNVSLASLHEFIEISYS